ncbi:ATP-binding protein [Cystobacter fuscus]|uniref:ATP-binding protein n=1 Tax=Cystobacter fuscus TaxID=43 RepID=UPI000BB2DE3F|nr:ATP-binding protein [Cystobacter fuscus]
MLILDEFGLEPLGSSERKELLEVLENRYGVGATVVTSQLESKDWHAVIGDATLADAILDRLVHNAHRLKLSGDSVRRPDGNLTRGPRRGRSEPHPASLTLRLFLMAGTSVPLRRNTHLETVAEHLHRALVLGRREGHHARVAARQGTIREDNHHGLELARSRAGLLRRRRPPAALLGNLASHRGLRRACRVEEEEDEPKGPRGCPLRRAPRHLSPSFKLRTAALPRPRTSVLVRHDASLSPRWNSPGG